MRRRTTRRVGAGGAGPTAAAIVRMPPVLTEAYEALSTGNMSWKEFAAVSEAPTRSKSMRPYTRSKSMRPYTRRSIRTAAKETRKWKRRKY
jgi:hypothetical protein